MSEEKIDLYVVCRSAEMLPKHWHQRKNTLALVRAVRAARQMESVIARFGEDSFLASYEKCWDDLHAALAPFTDSAEVRSDG